MSYMSNGDTFGLHLIINNAQITRFGADYNKLLPKYIELLDNSYLGIGISISTNLRLNIGRNLPISFNRQPPTTIPHQHQPLIHKKHHSGTIVRVGILTIPNFPPHNIIPIYPIISSSEYQVYDLITINSLSYRIQFTDICLDPQLELTYTFEHLQISIQLIESYSITNSQRINTNLVEFECAGG